MTPFRFVSQSLARRIVPAAIAVVVSALASQASGQQGTATFTVLPFIDPASSQLGDVPYDVNASGVVVGVAGIGDDAYRSVQWNAAGVASDLGIDPDYTGSVANSISANGQVICGRGVESNGFIGRASIWTQAEGIRRLPDLVSDPDLGNEWSEAYVVSDDGSTIWGISTTSRFFTQIVRWNASTLQLQLIGTLDDGPGENYVEDCSVNGQIAVGHALNEQSQFRAIRIVNTDITLLPRLPGGGESFANGTNSIGSVVVGHQNQGSNSNPYIWRAGSGIEALPHLNASSTIDITTGLADNGVIVGASGSDFGGDDDQVAMLWIAERPVALRTYLQSTYGVSSSSLPAILMTAAISRDGRYVTGYGRSGGLYRGFRVHFAGNRPPMANAGADVRKNNAAASGVNIKLDGRKSADPDGDTLSFRWSGIRFNDKTLARPTAKFPVGTTTVLLEVRDAGNVLSTDSVRVIVKARRSKIRPQGLAANEAFADAATLAATAVGSGETNDAALVAAENAAAANAIGAAIGDAFVWGEDESPAGAAAEYGAFRLMQSAYGQAAAASLAQAYLETGDAAYAEAYRSAALGTQRALLDVAD